MGQQIGKYRPSNENSIHLFYSHCKSSDCIVKIDNFVSVTVYISSVSSHGLDRRRDNDTPFVSTNTLKRSQFIFLLIEALHKHVEAFNWNEIRCETVMGRCVIEIKI